MRPAQEDMTAEDEDGEHEEEKPSTDVKTILPACLVKSLNAGGPPYCLAIRCIRKLAIARAIASLQSLPGSVTEPRRATGSSGELRRAPVGEPPESRREPPESRRRAAGEPPESRWRAAGESPESRRKIG